MTIMLMCPHCGWMFVEDRVVPAHRWKLRTCPGSGQVPRNPESDRRPLWKDEMNQSCGSAPDEDRP